MGTRRVAGKGLAVVGSLRLYKDRRVGVRRRDAGDWEALDSPPTVGQKARVDRSSLCNNRSDASDLPFAVSQIARAKQVKEHYIHHEIKKAKEQREKGEQRATGGVMRLGLIDSDSGSEGGQEKGSSDKK